MKYLKIFFIVVLIICVLIGIQFLFVVIVFTNGDVSTDFQTDYGDTFRISYDGFMVETSISDNNSRFYVVVKGKIESREIVGLINTTDLKVYVVKDIIFYDEGNGFEIFGSDTKNERVISLARDNLSSKRFYSIMQKSK